MNELVHCPKCDSDQTVWTALYVEPECAGARDLRIDMRCCVCGADFWLWVEQHGCPGVEQRVSVWTAMKP